MATTELPFYDLVRDTTDDARQLADALRKAIEDYRKANDDATDHDVQDALRLVQLDYGN